MIKSIELVPLVTSTNPVSLDDSARQKRIVDARIFRQRCSSKCAEQTLRLEHEDINQVWMQCVTDAREAAHFKRYDRAEELLKSSIEFSTNTQQLAYSNSFLAEIYYQTREYEKAEPLCLEVISLHYNNEESTHRADLATALHNTAYLYQAMKQFDQAEKCYLEAVRIRTEFMKFDDVLMIAVVHDYKSCIRERNKAANPWTNTAKFESHN
ncbi:hypothetical protein BH10CYA1_BH10CYA1_28660 [soil metagenome]